MAKPTESDRATYATAMRALAPMTDAELGEGLALMRLRTLARGEHLLVGGARATDVAVVTDGLLREYFVIESPRGGEARVHERTKAFVMAGRVSGSLADLLSKGASRAFIVAEEPTRILAARYATLRELSARSAAWAALGRAAIEALLLAKAEREWELLGLDAEARYRAFRARYPGLEARVAARHVASYLGITAVHLSRLRSRARRAPRPTSEGSPRGARERGASR